MTKRILLSDHSSACCCGKHEREKTVLQRFEEKIDKSGDCWIWTAVLSNRRYGKFKLKGKMMSAHRASWIFANGKIPDGMCVLHHCDNPPCVNPDHLWLGTNKDNSGDMIKKGRARFGGYTPHARLSK